MSVRMYFGEYLVSPAPIHMGLNWCSHQCFYCFANLNRPGRRADYASVQQFMGKVARKAPGKDIAAWLALQGHPIVASNDSDPFAASNSEQNQHLMRAMMDAGLRFVFQTRGGKGALEMLAEHPPTLVYISFTTDQPATVRAAEPGAPSHAERMELAAHAKRHGHFVVAGLNPFYPPWWDDVHAFLEWLAAQGIRHAWLGEPHLNYMQARAIPSKARESFSAEIAYFGAAGGRRKPQIHGLADACAAYGINTFMGASSSAGNFWQPYFDLGYPFWPTLEGWFDHLKADCGGAPAAFTFDAFDRWADATGGLQSSSFKEYIHGIGRSLRNDGLSAKAGSMRQVHEYLWRIHELPTRMRHDDIFLGTQDGQLAADDQGRFVLVYAPGITDPRQGRFDIDECVGFAGLDEQDQQAAIERN